MLQGAEYSTLQYAGARWQRSTTDVLVDAQSEDIVWNELFKKQIHKLNYIHLYFRELDYTQ